jgi:hypothetical protein
MAIIDVPIGAIKQKRRRTEQVLGLPESGPSSRGSTYWRRLLACPREHFLGNVLGWAPLDRTDPLEYGLLWHVLMEQLYLDMRDVQHHRYAHAVGPDTRVFETLRPFFSERGWEEGAEKIGKMLDAYLSRWYRTDLSELAVEATEETFQITLEDGFGFEWSNRMDLRGIDHSQFQKCRRHWEHKTTWRMDSELILGFRMDLQITGQTFLMTREFGEAQDGLPYLGAIVNIIARPSSTSARSREPDTAREVIQSTPTDIAAWIESMRFHQRLLATYQKMDEYPRNYNSCVRRYGRCAFFNLCQARPQDTVGSLRDEDARIRAGEASHMPGYRYANEGDSDD